MPDIPICGLWIAALMLVTCTNLSHFSGPADNSIFILRPLPRELVYPNLQDILSQIVLYLPAIVVTHGLEYAI